MRDFAVTDEFAERGGCEPAFVSVTSDRMTAYKETVRDAPATAMLVKVRADHLHYLPVDIHWCSAFPRMTEFNVPIKEYVFPPWTHLRPIFSLLQPRPAEEQKKGPGGTEVTLKTWEAQPEWPEPAGGDAEPPKALPGGATKKQSSSK